MAKKVSEIKSWLKRNDISFVRFMWCDNAGLIRAKAVHTRYIDPFLKGEGVGIAMAQQAVPVMYDAPAPASGLTPVGEVHMVADWDSLQMLPYSPGHARVFAYIYDGKRVWGHDSRSFLHRMIEKGRSMGFEVKAAFENEFILLERDENGIRPVDETLFAQTYALDRKWDFIQDVEMVLTAQGIYPEMLYAESSSGQLEMPVRYKDALGAADQQVAYRESVKAVAYDYDLVASFVPKIFEDKAGSGSHLHVSLWRDGKNVMLKNPGKELSEIAGQFIAGVLNHLPGLMALTTPSTNSYRRIKPHFWSGAFGCWGYGNREAAIRVPVVSGGLPGDHIELKTVDSTCNPYLALGAMMAAGFGGVEKKMKIPEEVVVDPGTIPIKKRKSRGINRLPKNLGESVKQLKQDKLLMNALGEDLARSFVAVREMEWEEMRDLSLEEEVEMLLERY